jgi:diguanylate cyclase (GGDEF)-like protein/PAS domain S-box-containing protein
MKTKPSVSRKMQLAFGSAILVSLVVGTISIRGMIVSAERSRWVHHTDEVLENLRELLASMQSVESSYRGFTLTGNESYLVTYGANIASVARAETTVASLTADNPAQQRRIPALERSAAEKIRFGDTVIGLRRAKGLEAAADAIRVGSDQQMMNEFQNLILEMQNEEVQLLVARNVHAKRSFAQTYTVLILGACLGILFAIAAGWSARREHAARALAEETVRESEERLNLLVQGVEEYVILMLDPGGRVTTWNQGAERIKGYRPEEIIGEHFSKFCTAEAIAEDKPSLGQNQIMSLPSNCILIRRDGFEIPIEDSVAPIHDPQGQSTGAVIVFRDVSATKAMALQMTHSAQHDFLTGLPNRMLLNDRIEQAIIFAPRHKKKVVVLFLDLDGFKHINDSLGHQIGDKLLQSVAKRLADCVRGSDTVSRQGGDEFVVLLSEVEHAEDAAITARRMLHVVAEAHPIDKHDLHVSTSIGVSVYPDDGLDAETLIKNADTAMYQAKENGRQSYQFFKPSMNVRAVERQSIEENLRRALERQEFTLHYQPKINLRTGEITGAEALLRWTHPVRGPVSPAQFIPVAEDCGLIVPISQWALRQACTQARAWLDAGLALGTMAVNISAIEFRHDNFLEGVFAILDDTGLDPKSLELELTESVLMKKAEATESILKTLRARGVQIAVDDFGTGYSSLSYLRKFPMDALKIDQSFVQQITDAPGETTIVTAIISMGRSLNLRVVAEGVETHEQFEFLRAHQCDEAQGYYFSRPVVAEQFAKLLETGMPETVLR